MSKVLDASVQEKKNNPAMEGHHLLLIAVLTFICIHMVYSLWSQQCDSNDTASGGWSPYNEPWRGTTREGLDSPGTSTGPVQLPQPTAVPPPVTTTAPPILSVTTAPPPLPPLPSLQPAPTTTMPAPAVVANVATAMEASDVFVGDEQRSQLQQAAAEAGQIQTINERFDAAKRRVVENRLRPGIQSTRERRKLLETLLRRPQCARRVRSWRTENSDILRGDPIPRNTSSFGMQVNHSVEADLHPGAMGLLSGMSGQWLSEENVPDNLIGDDVMT